MVVITGLLMQFNLWGQVPPITVHVEFEGTLSTFIDANQKYEITDLTLTGKLNNTDIKFIREMAGVDYYGNSTSGKLSVLDLSGANFGSNYRDDEYYRKPITIGTGPNYTTYYCWTYPNHISNFMFSDCHLKNIILPNSITLIEYFAFSNCISLTSIIIPNCVTSIWGSAFSNCISLTSIIIPNSVTSIGGSAFYGCTRLTNVTIGDSVTSIGSSAFYGCTGLTSIAIPNNITSISDYTFYGCNRLTSIIIPNNVTHIRKSTFENCSRLTSVTIGNSVTSIGESAFSGCTKLTEIYSRNSVPPITGLNCFQNVNQATCKLYVPKGSKSAYQSAFEWKEFYNIIEEGDITALNLINKDNAIVKSVANGIYIETKEQTPVSVYSLHGKKVYQSVINGNKEIRLNKDVYIVNVNNESEKVIVK